MLNLNDDNPVGVMSSRELPPIEKEFSAIESLLYPFHPEVLEGRSRLVIVEEEAMRRSFFEGKFRMATKLGPFAKLRGSLILQTLHVNDGQEWKASKQLTLSNSTDHEGISLTGSHIASLTIGGTLPSPAKTQIPFPSRSEVAEENDTVRLVLEEEPAMSAKQLSYAQRHRSLVADEAELRSLIADEADLEFKQIHDMLWHDPRVMCNIARSYLQTDEMKARRSLELELAEEVSAAVSTFHDEALKRAKINTHSGTAPLVPRPPSAPVPKRRFSMDTDSASEDSNEGHHRIFPGRKAPYYTTTYLGHEDLPMHYQLAYVAQREGILRRNYLLEEMGQWLDICEAAVESMAAIPISLRSNHASPIAKDDVLPAVAVPYETNEDAFSTGPSPASPDVGPSPVLNSQTAEATINSSTSGKTTSGSQVRRNRDETVTAAAKRRILGHDETMDRMGICLDEERARKGMMRLQPLRQ